MQAHQQVWACVMCDRSPETVIMQLILSNRKITTSAPSLLIRQAMTSTILWCTLIVSSSHPSPFVAITFGIALLTMAHSRLAIRSSRVLLSLHQPARSFSIRAARCNEFEALNKRANDTAPEYRKFLTSRPLNPHMTNTTSTIANEMPSVGKDAPPPELVTSVDPGFTPKDAVPENTERMTGGSQSSKSEDVSGSNKDLQGTAELGVGEMEGASFKVEPLRRTGEDENTMRARLLCPFPIPSTARLSPPFLY
jgi:hypothetical protein